MQFIKKMHSLYDMQLHYAPNLCVMLFIVAYSIEKEYLIFTYMVI